MADLRFDGRVAVVTGGGRGLGRSYAMLLASRGAKVVVNDPGGSLDGEGVDAVPADHVVGEITAAGGQAVACTESVTTREGGDAIIRTALEHYGRLDILIHNAGNVRRGSLKEMSYEDFDAVLDVHLRGAFNVVRPAFPVMCQAGYGRIVLTSSIGGLYGNRDVANYAVAKAGVIGLSNGRGARRCRRGRDMQCDRAGRGDAHGRRHRHFGLPADGHGSGCARGGLARARILFGDRGDVHRAGRSGGTSGHRGESGCEPVDVDDRGRQQSSGCDSKVRGAAGFSGRA